MKVFLSVLFCCLAFSRAKPSENSREVVPPQYLDWLLEKGKYDEFNRLMGIDIPHLSRPRIGNESHHPRFSPYLEHGDILLTPKQKENARQGVKDEDLKWDHIVPYYISPSYSRSQRRIIMNGINKLNGHSANCINSKPYAGQKDYIYVYPGDGCYSNLGRTGGQQTLSLDKNGCIDIATVIHEFLHAYGFYHEHCRPDRDQFITMMWNNIKPEWQSQFDMAQEDEVDKYGNYDELSVMHYPVRHPDVSDNKPCFKIHDPDIDENVVGYAPDATETDAEKIQNMYCGPENVYKK